MSAPLPRPVRMLALVSLLTDVASEMIYPLLPLFLGTVLGASAATVGAIEGAAESTASLLKLWSGRLSDRVRQRKPLVLAGYALAALARPLVALATAPAQVLAIRLTDRVGKGVRSAPRDALIADSVPAEARGRAFGFQRAADHAGAVLGPLLAFALLHGLGLELRTVFALAAVPGLLAVLVLWRGVRESPRGAAASPAASPAPVAAAPLPRTFRVYLIALALFTLGNATDAFLLLRASESGIPLAGIPLLWGMLHVVKSLASTPGGMLSDRVGRRPLILAGWALYATVYAGFALASQPWHLWALFALYGLHHGLTEGVEKALVADLVPAASRGAAFGWYNLVLGVGALPAALLFGAIWERVSPGAAFGTGAALALAAALLLGAVPRPQQQRAPGRS